MARCIQVYFYVFIYVKIFFIFHILLITKSIIVYMNQHFKRYKNSSLISLFMTKLQEKIKFGGFWWWLKQLPGPPWKAALEEEKVQQQLQQQ